MEDTSSTLFHMQIPVISIRLNYILPIAQDEDIILNVQVLQETICLRNGEICFM